MLLRFLGLRLGVGIPNLLPTFLRLAQTQPQTCIEVFTLRFFELQLAVSDLAQAASVLGPRLAPIGTFFQLYRACTSAC